METFLCPTISNSSNMMDTTSTTSFEPNYINDIEDGSENLGVVAGTHSTYVSDATAYYVIIIVHILITGLVSIVGIATNTLNIIVFIRQGVLTDNTNVSLIGLAVADFLCVTTMLWTNITFSVAQAKPSGLTWNPYDIMYITGGWPRIIAGLITRGVTTFVALERCVCVVFPFKVKIIFSPRNSLIGIACIFLYYIISYCPVFVYLKFQHVHDPDTNDTRLILVRASEFADVDAIIDYINLFCLNYASVGIVLFCTVITILRLQLSQTWRESLPASKPKTKDGGESKLPSQSTPPQSQTSEMSSSSRIRKEKKLIRMITIIAVTFLVCSIPNMAFLVMHSLNNEITTYGKYKNLAWVMFSTIFLSETVNSSINIVVYYKMSARYKHELIRLLGWNHNEK